MNNRHVYLWLASSTQAEEADLPSGKFVCRVGKGGTYSMCACAVLFTVFSVTSLMQGAVEFSAFAALLGIVAWFLFVYGLTYRCCVTNESMEESYNILFVKKKKKCCGKISNTER